MSLGNQDLETRVYNSLPPASPTHFQVEVGGSGLGLRAGWEGGEQPPPAAVAVWGSVSWDSHALASPKD